MNYIPKEGLEALKDYKYRSADKSPFSKYVLQPYWNYSIRFVPLWIAPNLVTLLGMVPLTLAYFMLWQICPDMNCGGESVPNWVFYLAGLGLFWYQTLDNLDGRQARRTGTSSPLGQLFDHGVDSVIVSIAGIVAAASSSLGPSLTLLQIWTGAFTFWFATWEEYHTGVLTLGYINGPTEGIIIVVFMLLGTGFFGPLSWLTPVSKFDFLVQTGVASAFGHWTIGQFTMLCCAIPCYITCFGNVYTVYEHVKESKKSFKPALTHLATFFSFVFISTFWWFSDIEVWSQYPYTFQLSISFAFAELTSRLILAHLCHLSYPFFQRPLNIVAAATVTSLVLKAMMIPLTTRLSVGFVFLGAMNVLFAHYCYGVITELCQHLHIKALTIPSRKD